MSGESGSAAVWTLWAAVLLVVTAVVGLGWAAAVTARQRAEAAADLAALSAARTLLAGGAACPAGGRVAAASGARLVACSATADSVTVVVEVAVPRRAVLGLVVPPARARARAGAPP
jgi:secretion/DNA translocation related TadE-like protein